ncbi:hypothetical protein U1Q18_007974 [Sarracenia purpurea var. burkii]
MAWRSAQDADLWEFLIDRGFKKKATTATTSRDEESRLTKATDLAVELSLGGEATSQLLLKRFERSGDTEAPTLKGIMMVLRKWILAFLRRRPFFFQLIWKKFTSRTETNC